MQNPRCLKCKTDNFIRSYDAKGKPLYVCRECGNIWHYDPVLFNTVMAHEAVGRLLGAVLDRSGEESRPAGQTPHTKQETKSKNKKKKQLETEISDKPTPPEYWR